MAFAFTAFLQKFNRSKMRFIYQFSEEFDVIPSVKPVEGESLPYIRETNRLGVFSWCVKELFSYTYEQLKAMDKEVLARNRDELKHKGSGFFALVYMQNFTEDLTSYMFGFL